MPSTAQVKILYPVIAGEISGGNVVCLQLIDEALRRGWDTVVTSPTDGPFCEMVRQRGVAVRLFNTARSFNLGAAVEMARLIRSDAISIVHTHTSFAGMILARLSGRLAGVPVITHGHGRAPLSRHPLVRACQTAMNWSTSRVACSAVIAVSEQTKQEWIRQGAPTNKVQVVYNGVDVQRWRTIDSQGARNRLALSGDRILVVHVGRLDENKGQHVLIRAARLVRNRRQDVRFLLVGEDLALGGSYRRTLELLSNELKVDDSVSFLGQRHDVPRILAAADMLVLPSFREGLPVIVLEAMAAGKPVVATPVGGVPELVSEGKTGLIVPVGNVQALADAILRLIANPGLAREMGKAGLERVAAKFSLDRMLEETFRVYEDVLNSRKN